MKTYAKTLREQANELTAQGVELRLAKGNGLYFARCEKSEVRESPNWVCTPSANGVLLSVAKEAIVRFEQNFEPVDFLTQSLERLRGVEPSDEAVELFHAGIKLIEHPEKSAVGRYLKKTRELAAVNLRLKSGGGYACARIAAYLDNGNAAQFGGV